MPIILAFFVGFSTQNLGLGFAGLIVGIHLDRLEDLIRDIKNKIPENKE